MEDVSKVVRPVEKQLMEKVSHYVESQFQRKLLRKKREVIVEKYKYFFNTELEFTIQNDFDALHQIFVVESTRNQSSFTLYKCKELAYQLKSIMNGPWLVDVRSAQHNHNKNIEELLVGQYLHTTSFETLTVFPYFSRFHLE